MKPSQVISAATTVALGNAGEGVVSTHVFQLVDKSSGSFSLKAEKRVRIPSDDPNRAGVDYVETPITKDSDGSDVAADTAVTAFGIYRIKSDGCDVQLTFTSVSGSFYLFHHAVLG